MPMVKSAPLLAIALFTATPALAQTAGPPPEGDPAYGEIVGTWASPRPQRSQVQDAFDLLDPCGGGTDPACVPKRTYVIHAANCMSIALHQDRLAVACRVDMTATDTVPRRKVRRYREYCARLFMQLDGNWAIFDGRDRPCAMPGR